MQTLTLNDGTVIENVDIIEAIVGLWIHIYGGVSLVGAFSLFSDPAKTSVITSVITADMATSTVYEHYTELFMIKQEDDGTVVIGLHKENQKNA